MHKVTADETNTFAMTIAIFIPISQAQYGPDVKKLAEKFKRLLNVTSCRTIGDTDELNMEEIRQNFALSDEPNDEKWDDDIIRNCLWEAIVVS
jgi:hypothetical protein